MLCRKFPHLAFPSVLAGPIEILVADSRQVYHGMEIGTAKPDATARTAVPHHLLDLVDPGKPFSVAPPSSRRAM